MRTLASILFTMAVLFSNAQLVSDQTNAIRLDFKQTENDKEIVLPTVQWEFPGREYTNSQERRAKFVAILESSKPIQLVEMGIGRKRGEKPLATKSFEVAKNTLRYKLEKEINLLDGENVISVTVTNVDGGVVTDYRNILVGFDAISKAIDINRRDYALLIGTDKYDHWNDLVNPVYDVETVSEILTDNYGFETEALTNPQQEDILIKIKEYSQKKYRPQDQLLIFIAGHGQFDEAFGEGYIVTKGSLQNDEAKTTYIPHSVLRNIVDNIPCEHILLVMDVCFSGTFDPVIARSRSAAYEDLDDAELLVRKLSKKTRRYLTSGGKEYVSDGVPGKHSPFAQKFIEVLKSRGGEDRIITLQEIYPVMQRLKTLPRTGEFGLNEKDSDFVFVVK
ncbi:MAG: caspase family protein [Cyclobacteriaceae bacterium]|nr:caspase family protein [Cyclobacteriaceae bacterium HetDA_MAG_MS6]